MEDKELYLKLGELIGLVSSQTIKIEDLSKSVIGLEARLRSNEKDTTKLTVKMGAIGFISGGVGSTVINILVARFL